MYGRTVEEKKTGLMLGPVKGMKGLSETRAGNKSKEKNQKSNAWQELDDGALA